MNRTFLNIESNSQLALACLLDPKFKKMAFSDAAALEEAYRHLVNEMAGLKSTTPDPEDNAGSSSSSQGHTRVRALFVQLPRGQFSTLNITANLHNF